MRAMSSFPRKPTPKQLADTIEVWAYAYLNFGETAEEPTYGAWRWAVRYWLSELRRDYSMELERQILSALQAKYVKKANRTRKKAKKRNARAKNKMCQGTLFDQGVV